MTTGEHTGAFDPAQQAMDVMLGEPRTGIGITPDEIRRPLLLDQDLAAKVMEQADGDPSRAAAVLRDTLANLPPERESWNANQAAGILYGSDPRSEGTYAIFGALGTNAQLASEFRSLTGRSAVLDSMTPDVARVSTIRSWNARGGNPEAGVIVTELLADKLTPQAFGDILAQRYYSVGRTGGGNVETLTNYGAMVQLLAQSSTLPDNLRERAQTQYEKIREEITAAQEQQYRTALIAHAKEAVNSRLDEASYRALLGPDGTLAEVREFNPDLSIALEITCNARYLINNPESSLLSAIQERQEALINILVATLERNEDLRLPQDMASAVHTEIMRRAKDLTTSDDPRYPGLLELAGQLKVNGLVYNIESQQKGQAADEKRRREQLEIMDGLGFESLDLPERISAMRVQVPNAHIEYDNVEELIADIERYFLDQRTEGDTYSDIRKRIDNPMMASIMLDHFGPQATQRIFTTMRDEMRAWASEKSRRNHPKKPFAHSEDIHGDGSPYKYEGSSFTGNRIRVHEVVVDGVKKYNLKISDGGRGYNAYNPNENLVPFAEAVGKQVDYEDIPSLEITIEPSEEELRRFAAMQTSDFEPTVNGNQMYHDALPVPVRELVNFYRQIIGLPETGERLNEVLATQAEAINGIITADERAYRPQVGIRLEDSTVVLGVDSRARVDAQGNLLAPITLFEKDGDDEGRSLYRPDLRIGLDAPDIDHATRREMVRRALLYQRNVRDRRWVEGELPGGWTRTDYNGLKLKPMAE